MWLPGNIALMSWNLFELLHGMPGKSVPTIYFWASAKLCHHEKKMSEDGLEGICILPLSYEWGRFFSLQRLMDRLIQKWQGRIYVIHPRGRVFSFTIPHLCITSHWTSPLYCCRYRKSFGPFLCDVIILSYAHCCYIPAPLLSSNVYFLFVEGSEASIQGK